MATLNCKPRQRGAATVCWSRRGSLPVRLRSPRQPRARFATGIHWGDAWGPVSPAVRPLTQSTRFCPRPSAGRVGIEPGFHATCDSRPRLPSKQAAITSASARRWAPRWSNCRSTPSGSPSWRPKRRRAKQRSPCLTWRRRSGSRCASTWMANNRRSLWPSRRGRQNAHCLRVPGPCLP